MKEVREKGTKEGREGQREGSKEAGRKGGEEKRLREVLSQEPWECDRIRDPGSTLGKLDQLLSFRPAQELLHPRRGRADTPLPAMSPRTGAPVPVATWKTTLALVVSDSAPGFPLFL